MSEVESVSIPVVEEAVKLGRESVQTGRVRVRTLADERTETVSEALLHTNVVIEPVPIEREIDAVPPVREEGGILSFPWSSASSTNLFLVEEVRLIRRASTEESSSSRGSCAPSERLWSKKNTSGKAQSKE